MANPPVCNTTADKFLFLVIESSINDISSVKIEEFINSSSNLRILSLGETTNNFGGESILKSTGGQTNISLILNF